MTQYRVLASEGRQRYIYTKTKKNIKEKKKVVLHHLEPGQEVTRDNRYPVHLRAWAGIQNYSNKYKVVFFETFFHKVIEC